MGTLDGKVAFISGIARGQGRSHALRLASEGADIIGIDICRDIDTIDYPNATWADLAETTKLIEQLDRRVIATEADVRDFAAVQQAVDAGVAELGRLDIVLSNAGIVRLHADADDPAQLWRDIVGTNMTGGFHVVNAAVPHLIAGGRGGVDRAHRIDRRRAASRQSRRRRARLHRVQVGSGGHVQATRRNPGRALHPGQHRPPDRRCLGHDHEPGHGRARRPGDGGRWRWLVGHAERHAGPDPAAGGHLRRDRLPGLRPGDAGSPEYPCQSTRASPCASPVPTVGHDPQQRTQMTDHTSNDEFRSLAEVATELGLDQAAIQPVTRQSVQLDDHQQVSVLAWGQAEPELVFLYGGGQNAHTWDLVITALGRPAIAIDLPGHGHSSWREDRDYGPAANAPAVARVISDLAPTASGVIGMSLGGLTLIRLAATRPDLVRRAVIVDVTPGSTAAHAQMSRSERGTTQLITEHRSFASLDEITELAVQASPRRPASAVRRGVRHNTCQQPDGTWTWRYDPQIGAAQGAHAALWNDLPLLAMPAMLVRGGDSAFVYPG